MSALLTVLAAAAPALIGKATEAAAEYGVDFFGADSSVGSFLSSTFVSKKPGEQSLASEIGTAVASAMGADRGRSIDDLPSVNIPSTTPVRPGQMASSRKGTDNSSREWKHRAKLLAKLAEREKSTVAHSDNTCASFYNQKFCCNSTSLVCQINV